MQESNLTERWHDEKKQCGRCFYWSFFNIYIKRCLRSPIVMTPQVSSTSWTRKSSDGAEPDNNHAFASICIASYSTKI